MKLTVTPGNSLRGTVVTPGDKSLSHRAVLFAALAEGESRISNFLVSGVTRVMLESLTALGVGWTLEGTALIVHGRGLRGFSTPEKPLNCGNSATTMRLLAGAIAAAGISAILDGSAGLRRRPMDRIVEPLRRMGVQIDTAEGGTAPITIHGRPAGLKLKGLKETLPVASAQVKSCLLLAALAAESETVLNEPGPSRDHTERMLGSMGVDVHNSFADVNVAAVYTTTLTPPAKPLAPITLNLPGDISAAAFLIVAGLITPGSEIQIPGVGINPTRTGLIDALREMGGDIQIQNETTQAGEPVGDLRVRSSRLHSIKIHGSLVVRMIDEFSVFGAAAAYADGNTLVRDAAELRLKESDRIHTLCEELSKLGVATKEAEDGFEIFGGAALKGGVVHGHGDHRLAMAMAVAGLAAQTPVIIEGAEIISESFPEFSGSLSSLGANLTTSAEVA